MAAIAATPLFMRDVKLTLKRTGAGTAKEFQCHVSEARVQVEPGDTVTVRTLCANGTFSSQGKPSYALVLVGVQDWDTTTGSEGLAAYLWAEEGFTQDFSLQAHGEAVAASATAPVMIGQCLAIPGDYGGEIDAYAELSVELPCVSKPTLSITGTLVAEDEATAEAA